MDSEQLRIIRGKYRMRDKVLRAATEKVRALRDRILETFSEITEKKNLHVDVCVYATMAGELEGYARPAYTILGGGASVTVDVGSSASPPLPANVCKENVFIHVMADFILDIKDSFRSKKFMTIHDITMLDDAMIEKIISDLIERMSAPEKFIDEFVLETNCGYGIGPKLPEDQEVIRRHLRKQKQEMDEEDRWKGEARE